jgi:hypothetical protein
MELLIVEVKKYNTFFENQCLIFFPYVEWHEKGF